MGQKILVADDDLNVLRVVAHALEYKGYRVVAVSSGESAVEALGNEDFALVITDLNMYEIDGFTVMRKAKAQNAQTKVILLTGDGLETRLVHALSPGFDDQLSKPCSLGHLLERVGFHLGESVHRPKAVLMGRAKETHSYRNR
ncbi:MAG: response regulator [Proteobacteria bacterium]|nr:response regulator [Pseudomonadota bacterium]NIS70147.1 response regulator [Pseudomonadota bacterium]